MRRYRGVTEPVWRSLPPGFRMKWRLFGLTAASIAALLVVRTGKPMLDLAFAVGGVVLSQVTVESQRWLSAVVDVSMRKRLIRSIVIAARLAVLLSGCTFFLGIAAAFSSTLLRPEVLLAPPLHKLPALSASLGLIVMAAITGHVLFKMFRDLQFEKAIWHMPAAALRRIFVEQQFVARSFPDLVIFELLTHVVVLGYCMIASGLVAALAGWPGTAT